jgi:DNA recombination protein RmuC
MAGLGSVELTSVLLAFLAVVAVLVLLFVMVLLPTRLRRSVGEPLTQTRVELATIFTALRTEIGERLSQQAQEHEQKLDNVRVTLDTRLEAVRETTERNLKALNADNTKQLEAMRVTVDEKLQATLEERIGQSFKLVSAQLEQVHKGLGEMQNLAVGVGDLKKVLSNVKTRGILGEIQLHSILTEILAPEQYAVDIATRPSSRERVEFAIRLPGDEAGEIWLPVDAKFHADAYERLLDAYESGSAQAVEVAGKHLDAMIRQAAKTIRDKYVEPPATTDFAILFLPFEGLYSEVVRRGMVEELQTKYHIIIAGPTTMAALLNSLQMGFKTLAIQKRSGEVWSVLESVRKEFGNFETVLTAAQKRITQTNDELEKLIGVRTRQINRQLDKVVVYEEGDKSLPQP